MGLQPEDHTQLNIYCDIKTRIQQQRNLTIPELSQMMQDYEREQDEQNERLGKKSSKTVLVNAVYGTAAEQVESSKGETASSPVDLK